MLIFQNMFLYMCMFQNMFLYWCFRIWFCVPVSEHVSVCFWECVSVFPVSEGASMSAFQNMFICQCFRISFFYVHVSEHVSVSMLQKILSVCQGPRELSRLLEKFASLLVSGSDSSSQGQAASAPSVKTLFLNVARAVNNLAMDIKSQSQLEVCWLFLSVTHAPNLCIHARVHHN